MKKNIEDIQDRGARINELEDKTNNLAESAQHFRRGANRVRKQMWWKDMKMRVCLIVGIIVLLLVIIVPAGKAHHSSPITQMAAANKRMQLLPLADELSCMDDCFCV